MHVRVNGEAMELPAGITVAGLIERLGLAASICAAEVNQKLVPKREHGTHELREGDAVEIVTLVGGG